jgi:Siphovirus Gp157
MSDEPRGPSPYTIEQCVSAWQRARAQLAGDPDLADDENAISAALGAFPGVQHPDEVIRRIVRAVMFATTREAEAKVLTGTYRARQARYAKRLAVLRGELFDLMSIMNYSQFKAMEGTVSIARGRPSAVITDEEKIPMKYVKMIREINRTALKDDLQQGVVIEGAYLSNAGQVLKIKGIAPIEESEGEPAETTEQGAE